MPLRQVPRPPDPSRVAALLAHGRRADGGDPSAARLEAGLRAARRPGIITVPEQLRFGRLAVPTAAVVALLALAVAVGCLFLVRVLWAERLVEQSVPASAARPTVTHAGASGSAAPTSGAAGATLPGAATARGGPSGAGPSGAGAVGQVVVHVVGQVARPGLVRLRQGARVADAISAAGGATKRADLAALNLARLLADGEQVYVPRPGETLPGSAGTGAGGAAGPAAGTSGGGAGGSTGAVPVNLNTADLAALEALPGVGPVLAQRIVDWRTEHGRFSSVDELREVSGIGDKMFARLQPKVTV